MNVAALAVGVGALCLVSTGDPRATPTPLFSGPVFVAASGSVNRVAALELLRTVDLSFTMDDRDWPKLGSYRTLVIVPGFRVDWEDEGQHEKEVNRIRGLIAQAKKANASILLLHLGGVRSRGFGKEAWRTDESNRLAALSADYIVVAGAGNQDGFFTSHAAPRGIPVETVGAMSDAGDALMRLFKVGPRVSPGSVGSVLPPLSTRRTPDGSAFEFASLRGRWLALHFWNVVSSEIGRLRTYQAKYGERVQFVGVAVDSYEFQWKRRIDDLPANWQHVLNGTGDKDLAALFDVHVLPLRFLIDPSGKVVGRFVSDQDFFTKLDELFRLP